MSQPTLAALRGAATTPRLARPRAGARLQAFATARPELLALLALAALVYLWGLDRNGWANDYYSAAVRTMSESWHAFLYGAFDSAGVMTVDKPPLALWVQALSARIFGFSSWSLLVPQALMGVAAVGLTYDLTRRPFGRAAGFAAGLALALTPITVAIFRHNNPDALLVLACVAALWGLVRALEDGRTRWLVLSGAAVGLGFEAKLAAALLVVPGIVAAYLYVAPRGRLAAVRQLAAGGAAMTVVGLACPVLMWLTPAADRPWVSGTSDNSIWSLILGYNGLGRLLGQDGGPAGANAGGPGGGGVFGGDSGVLRLLNESLGSQGGWLLGVALVGGLAILAVTRLRRADARTGWLVGIGGAFLVTAVAFSGAEGIFHPYYVSQLAPFTAALVGGGLATLATTGRTTMIVAPLVLAAGVAVELVVLEDTGLTGLIPVVMAVGAGAAVVLATTTTRKARALAVAAVLGVLLLAPASWSVQTLGHATSSTFPAGGPAETTGFGGGGAPFGGGSETLSEAVAYPEANGGGTVAVASQSGAAGQLITDGADVAAIGGFSGRESQVTTAWLADAVEDGRIRYVLTESDGMQMDGRIGASQVMAAVEEVGAEVDSVTGLYDLQGKADELRALTS